MFDGGVQISRKFRSHLKILGATGVTRTKFRTQYPQILGASVQNLVGRDLCTPDLSKDKVISSEYERELMNSELDVMWKEAVLAQCERLWQYLSVE